ncbi:MAG: hypothetical protein ACRYF2_19110 [Janthinobacterium lividum]
MMNRVFLLALPILPCLGGPTARSATPNQIIPFVGCPAEGMSGPVAAPTGSGMPISLPVALATRLAHYAADGMDVLAPRGWHCIEVYGSDGAVLLVTPELLALNELRAVRPLRGPVVELSYLNGWTSGRFDVARVMARLFPWCRAFVRRVIQEGLEPARTFLVGPYPADKMTRHGRSEVEFTTPAGRIGMGTAMDRISPSEMPVSGLARLTTQDGVTLLDVRLPAGLRPLTAAIIQFSRSR